LTTTGRLDFISNNSVDYIRSYNTFKKFSAYNSSLMYFMTMGKRIPFMLINNGEELQHSILEIKSGGVMTKYTSKDTDNVLEEYDK
jgi:hypothetical protein